MMQMTFCIGTDRTVGSMENESRTRILTEPVVLYQVQLRPIWRRDIPWMNLWNGRKTTYPGHFRQGWILEKEVARWIMDMTCRENILLLQSNKV